MLWSRFNLGNLGSKLICYPEAGDYTLVLLPVVYTGEAGKLEAISNAAVYISFKLGFDVNELTLIAS